jgi:C4-dicarboxylate-binding protein DctP
MKIKHLLMLAITGTMLAACDSSTNKATGAREVEPVELTLANPYPGDSEIGEWVHEVERLSRGAARIEVRGDWRKGELDADRRMLRDVRAGRVDVAHIPAYAWDTLGVQSLQALEAPLLVDSFVLQERVVTGELGATMLAGVRAAGVEPVGLLPGPLKHPVGLARELRGPADYGGAAIGMRPSAVHEATMRALGARVVARALGRALPPALDGSEADLSQVDAEPFRGHARSVTADVVLWPRPTTLVMNRDAWQDLTSDQQAVLRDAARAAASPFVERERRLERGGLKVLCDGDTSLVRAGAAGAAALRRAVEPVYRRLERDADSRAALEEIRSLKADVPAAPTPACATAEPARVPADSPVVGTWQVHVSAKELAAAPRVTGERVEDNWGTITLELAADGSFEMLNDRYPGQPQGLGTWTVRGDVLTFTPGGTVSQGAGETWRYRWTLFRDSLVLRRLSRDAGPTVLMVAPLRRR